MSLSSISSTLKSFALALFGPPATKRRPASFKPQMEGLEERWCPTTALDYWQPAGANHFWNTARNWSLGWVPKLNDSNGNDDIARFDGNHANGNVDCECDVNPPVVYGLELTGGYAKTLYIDSGITVESKYYLRMDGTLPKVDMKGSSTLLIDGSDASQSSTWSSGSFVDANGTIKLNGSTNLTVTGSGYTDSDILVNATTAMVTFDGTLHTPSIGKDNAARVNNHGTVKFRDTGTNDLADADGGVNTYIHNYSDGTITVIDTATSSTFINIGIENEGTLKISGAFKIDGTAAYANDLHGYCIYQTGTVNTSFYLGDPTNNDVRTGLTFVVPDGPVDASGSYRQDGGVLYADGGNTQSKWLVTMSNNAPLTDTDYQYNFLGGYCDVGDNSPTKSGVQLRLANTGTSTACFFGKSTAFGLWVDSTFEDRTSNIWVDYATFDNTNMCTFDVEGGTTPAQNKSALIFLSSHDITNQRFVLSDFSDAASGTWSLDTLSNTKAIYADHTS